MERRILLILPYGGVGGMERLAATFYRSYVSQGYTVKVLKVIRLPDDVVDFGQDEMHLSDHDLSEMRPISRIWFYLSAPFKLRTHIKRNRISHSIAFGDVANLYSSLTFTREFKVASVHSLKSVDLGSNTLLARVTKVGYRSVYRFFDKVVSISGSVRKDLLANCDYAFPDRLEVVYNPHDVGFIMDRGLERLPDSDLGIFARPVVIFLGRLSSPKAPWRLVDAFSRLLGDGVDANLAFVGDGSEEVLTRLKAMVDDKGLGERVFFLGRQVNPYKYLAKSSVLALTSAYEGTPNVIVESIALGVPVVSSYSTGGIAELMCVSGDLGVVSHSMQEVEAGFITPHYPDGVDALGYEVLTVTFARALKRAIEDPGVRQRLSASRSQLLQKFEVKSAASRYLD